MVTWNLRLQVLVNPSVKEDVPDNTIGWTHLYGLSTSALPRIGEVVALDVNQYPLHNQLLQVDVTYQPRAVNVEHVIDASDVGSAVIVTVRVGARMPAKDPHLATLPDWVPAASR